MKLPFFMASKFIAGENVEDAVKRAKKNEAKGLYNIIDALGEFIKNEEQADQGLKQYLHLIDIIKKQKLKHSCISIKLSHFGLLLNKKNCLKRVKTLSQYAKKNKVFLWIDMEHSKMVDDTLNIYLEILKNNKNCGVTVKTHLRRSKKDVENLIKKNASIRLVKGAYPETTQVAFTEYEAVRKNFLTCMNLLFESNNYFHIATHDLYLISEARTLMNEHPNAKAEFAMLMGVYDDKKEDFLKQGLILWEYLPFGKEWMPYFTRRIREKPSNILVILKSLLLTTE